MGLQGEVRRIKGVADIVLCLDVTGSMTPCLEKLKQSMGRFVASLEAPRDVPGTNYQVRVGDWRIRVLGFRDLFRQARLSPMVDDLPFVCSADAVRDQLSDPRLVAGGGGGDGPESAMDALYRAARNSAWRPTSEAARFVVLFTDAPALATMHPSTVGQGGPSDVFELLQALRATRVRPVIFGPADARGRVFEQILEAVPLRLATSRLFENRRAAIAFFGDPDPAAFGGLMDALAQTVSVGSTTGLGPEVL